MYAVIADLVGSRQVHDRGSVQRALHEVLAEVSEVVPGAQPWEPTVGDEFQGAYDDVAAACRASLLVRLALLPVVDVRFGLGFGETTVFDHERTPLLQDGTAWWAAREALGSMAAARRSGVRTWVVGPDAARVNAFLLCRDGLVGRLSERGWRMLGLALRGRSQQEIAALEGISKSAVSQAFARGIGAVRDAQSLLEEPA